MILIPQLSKDILELFAYSFQDFELDIVGLFLEKNKIEFSSNLIRPDENGRKGRIFSVAQVFQIERLERVLGVRFLSKGMTTKVDFHEDEGVPYRCIRIKHMPWVKGCADIVAVDDHAALLKCALLANEHNWYGVVSERGKCREW